MADTPRVAAPLQHGKMVSLSGSTDDRGIKIVATATLGTVVHKNTGGTTQLLYLFASNTDGTNRKVTFEVGGVTDPDDLFEFTATADTYLELPNGIPLGPGKTLTAFAAAGNVIIIRGYAVAIG
jgi:hypothetical protein